MLLTIYYVIIQKMMSPRKLDEDVMIKFCKLQAFKNTFFTEHLRWLLLEWFCGRTSLVKILQSCHFNMFGINLIQMLQKDPHGKKIMNNRDC